MFPILLVHCRRKPEFHRGLVGVLPDQGVELVLQGGDLDGFHGILRNYANLWLWHAVALTSE